MKKTLLSLAAAFVVITPQGKTVYQVLGDSTSLQIPAKSQIQVKNIAENVNSNEISLANNNGKIELNGVDVTNMHETLVDIESRPNSNEIQIGNSNGKFSITENNITALTSFPITIDPSQNELSVQTNSGNRLVSILPYEASLTLMRAGTVDSIKNNQIALEESSNGELQYNIDGVKNLNLFNVVSLKEDIAASVSASTGAVLNTNEPVWLHFLTFMFSK
ncbi:MAG TPA: hypothetical protein VG895_04995 [Patescibacteria group bacterium]|nr:hypothetical protein [Patescibacteria group bacterium]